MSHPSAVKPRILLVDEGHVAELLRAHAARWSVPGAVLGILHRGQVTAACFGVADLASGLPVSTETRFSAGSLTKTFVATLLVGLAHGGQLPLDDPVTVHVPELHGASWASRATVRDLMSNLSGLPLRASLEFGFDNRTDEDDGALARLVADLPRDERASRFWSYSNVGWCVLGRVIETVTGQPFEEAIDCFLDDLGMRATEAAGTAATRARGHAVTGTTIAPVEPLDSRAYAPAGARLVTTAGDLLEFARVHLDDPSLAEVRTVHSDVVIHGWLDGWGLGLARFRWDGDEAWGWDGLVPGERAVVRLFPHQRSALVLLTNADTGRAMYRSLFADLLPELLGIRVPPLRLEPVPDAAGDLSRFAGVYAWPDRRVEVTAVSDGLHIELPESSVNAAPLDARTFVVDPADPDQPTVTFGRFDGSMRPQVLYDMLWGLPRIAP